MNKSLMNFTWRIYTCLSGLHSRIMTESHNPMWVIKLPEWGKIFAENLNYKLKLKTLKEKPWPNETPQSRNECLRTGEPFDLASYRQPLTEGPDSEKHGWKKDRWKALSQLACPKSQRINTHTIHGRDWGKEFYN